MKLTRENAAALAVLAVVLLLNGWALRADLHSGGVDLNDNVSHFRLLSGMVSALESGGNPLDFWSPEWSFGFPLVRVYQPLAHLLVVALYFALGKSVGLMTVFVWTRYLAVVLLPLSFFALVRCLKLPRSAALAAACLAPMISTPQLYGLEYESYVWAGFGLFPQAVATHFLLLALGCGYRALRGGASAVLAGVLLGCAFLCQFVYGYMGALSIVLLALLPERKSAPESALAGRLKRVAWMGVTALALAAFQLLPLWIDRALINPTPADQLWKSDSFGAGQVLGWLVTGQLLDHGRLPVLSLLALAGAILLGLRHFSSAGMGMPGKFALAGAGLWLLLFCGRPLWGPALYLFGVTRDLPLHRVLAGAQIFLVLLAAIAFAALWDLVAQRVHIAAAATVALALLYPMAADRTQYLDLNASRLQRTVESMQADRPALDGLLAALRRNGGRAFAGLNTATSWGPSFRVGAVPMYHVLAAAGIPTVGYLSHTMALTAPVLLDFGERNPAHYRLFDVTSFIVPSNTRYPVPPFLKAGAVFGRFQIYETPANGYFDLVDVTEGLPLERDSFGDAGRSWLRGPDLAQRRHTWFGLPGERPQVPPAVPATPPGEIASAGESAGAYRATWEAQRPAWALFKMTYHPNWKASLDGRPAPLAMVSPGFAAVPAPAGRHTLEMRYQGSAWKLWLALGGMLAAAGLAFVERRV
ncbi:MAG: hypothetical protein ABI759_29450 [Candidatus Solibacter sp.]